MHEVRIVGRVVLWSRKKNKNQNTKKYVQEVENSGFVRVLIRHTSINNSKFSSAWYHSLNFARAEWWGVGSGDWFIVLYLWFTNSIYGLNIFKFTYFTDIYRNTLYFIFFASLIKFLFKEKLDYYVVCLAYFAFIRIYENYIDRNTTLETNQKHSNV